MSKHERAISELIVQSKEMRILSPLSLSTMKSVIKNFRVEVQRKWVSALEIAHTHKTLLFICVQLINKRLLSLSLSLDTIRASL
jgi:hypothetical protein